MVRAVVCCTKCAEKFEQDFPDKNWGEDALVTCSLGHESLDVLYPETSMTKNDTPMPTKGHSQTYYENYFTDDEEDPPPELVAA